MAPALPKRLFAALALSLSLALSGCSQAPGSPMAPETALGPQGAPQAGTSETDLSSVPRYGGSPYAELNGNVPDLTESDAEGLRERYSPLDSLGRCGAATAVVSRGTMPRDGQGRGDISDIHPTGWEQAEYAIVPGGSLYNRCHLIGWQLTAEDDNAENLITGTRYLNVEGMLPFEDRVADYVESTGGRLLYRVTPVFSGSELLCRGVQMEALSLGDDGRGLSFNVFCYNVQPSIEIDYATGSSRELNALPPAGGTAPATNDGGDSVRAEYVLNENTRKFHRPECPSVDRISESNRRYADTDRDSLIAQGYSPCKSCNP